MDRLEPWRPDGGLPADLAARLDQAIAALTALSFEAAPDAFQPAAAEAIVSAGLQAMTLPRERGGLGAGIESTAEVLAAVAAVDGSTALGLSMHSHVLGGTIESGTWPSEPLDRLCRSIADDGALLNSAATEEMTGSPARGGLPDATARRDGGDFVLNGEKSWTTWLPALRWALVTARIVDEAGAGGAGDPPSTAGPRIGSLLVDLDLPGIERLPAFEALGMRGSASGRLRLTNVRVPAGMLVFAREPGQPDPRGASPQGWFGLCLAATYLGIGEGARQRVVRWAIDRRPGDGSTAVADLPTVQLRLGRLDASLRVARLVTLDVARRWDAAEPGARAALLPDVSLAKVTATNAAVTATDEALRIAGGPGFLAGPIERAFRDARAGLINPPLDDVALTGFAERLIAADRARPG